MKKVYEDFNNFINKNILIPLLILSLFQIKTVYRFLYEITHKTGEYDTQGIGVITTSILAIATIYLAWIAFKASQKANMISLLALESERPELVSTICLENVNHKKSTSLVLKNESKTEAINICIFFKKYNENLELIEDKINLSRGINYKKKLFEGVGGGSFLVFYTNPLNNKRYALAYTIDSGDNNLHQLNEDDGYIKYSRFIEIYKNVNNSKLSVEALIQLV